MSWGQIRLSWTWMTLLVLAWEFQPSESRWSSWKPYTACSRSCGTGVKYRQRECMIRGSHSNRHRTQHCPGKDIAYRLCNTQECPEGSKDFRTAQCEEFNTQPLDGEYYRWLPYYGHGRTCELLCAADGFRFYHNLKEKVVDGTQCGEDSNHICIDGACKSIGCDKRLGSKMTVDVCGVCGGDNSTCRRRSNMVQDKFDDDLNTGYNAVVEIPKGASDIYITDVAENRNSLVLWDSSGDTFLLDTETRKTLTEIPLAGTRFTFNPENIEKTMGTIQADGPTQEDITVYIVNEGHRNPGILYGFYHPNPPLELTGRGNTHAQPNPLDENARLVPVTNVLIVDSGNTRIEPERTNTENYDRQRPPVDVRVDGNDREVSPDLSSVHGEGGRYMWTYGQWTGCSNGCGNGYQRRYVSCIDREERTSTDPAYCDSRTRPQSTRRCNNGNCKVDTPGSYVQWRPAEWGPCSTTCDLGEQNQLVVCEAVFDDGTSAVVDDERCLTTYKSKPQYQRSCNDGVACPKWSHSAWGACSASCGPGRQQRRVVCYGEGRNMLADDSCNPDMKPVELRRCNERACLEQPSIDQGRSCENSYFGCCPDGATPAQGSRMEGCRVIPEPRTRQRSRPRVLQEPRDTQFMLYQPASLNCRADGQPPPLVSWYQDDRLVLTAHDTNKMILDNGQLFFLQAMPSDEGLYHCNATNRYGTALSRKARVQVSDNIVITEDDATTTRAPVQTVGRCEQGPAQGPCQNFTVEWYYDKDINRCKQFWYGNCDGNENRFSSESECDRACKKERQPEDVCRLPAVAGRCRARIPRYHYNYQARECQLFYYGGCGGNDNRFRSKVDCERQCQAGTSALGDDQLLCERSTYGCCPDGVTSAGGENNKGCPSSCENTPFRCCEDGLTAAQGPNMEGCDDIDIYSGSGMGVNGMVPCDQTRYGCCWDKVTPVEDGCPPVPTTAPPPTTEAPDVDLVIDGALADDCRLAKETGPCRHNLTVMWYYDTAEGKCMRFWYGGCHGNGNRFKTEKECRTICRGVVEPSPVPSVPVCQQKKEIGPCSSALNRWYHNPNTRQCEEFLYSGCQGNNNNFVSRDACETYCRVRTGTPVMKPYECPAVKTSYESCTSNCVYDGDCPGNEKCCANSNGCRSCTSPYVPRPVTREQVCNLAPEVGPCRAAMPRWHFNMETRQCEEFIYGGCGGNQNNFETEETCQRYCRMEGVVDKNRQAREPVCQLEPNIGPCRRAEKKWAYNITTMQCSTFTYGGCLGNHNNFETETKCLTYCGLRTGLEREATCKLPHEVGGCRGNIRRYYYDARSGSCFPFGYGGCQGNANNFATDEECMSECRGVRMADNPQPRPQPRPTVAPVTAAPAPTPATEDDVCTLPLVSPCNRSPGQYWYYEKESGLCKEVPNGECNNNRNNFQSREQCERYCDRQRVCQTLTYSTDMRCLALIPRWTYDPSSGQCEEFSYGGCGGSANNFESLEACERKCEVRRIPPTTPAPRTRSRDEICALSKDSGNCLANFPKWHYDMEDGTCKEFVFGGCGGNENKFDTREECERFCDRSTVCREFVEPEIVCYAYIPRWRYSSRSGRCENFIYGGCGGNANNFGTNEACERKCIPSTTPVERNEERNNNRYSTWRDICNMQADVGPCEAYMRKWHFNSVSQDCEEFTYGGCLGNHNNFDSRLQCMTYCDPTRSGGTRPDPEEVEGSGDIDKVDGIEVCHQPMVIGDCRASIPSWFYDHLEGECRQFIYGGCGGNQNRFESKEDCDAACVPSEVCKLPQKNGPCMKYLPRYFFDFASGECVEFAYGGCDGNANNFERKEACMKRCGPLVLDRQPVVEKNGSCPIMVGGEDDNDDINMGVCLEECRSDSDCSGDKKCCVNGCSLVCLAPNYDNPTRPSRRKSGYCPAKIDRQGLLGACAPACQYDSDCRGNQKCCHVSCGPACHDPVDEEPYQMQAPVNVRARVAGQSIYLHWQDPALGDEQKIKDSRYYTVRYFSYSIGRYEYKNVTDLVTVLTGLEPETEFEMSVRVNNPPYLSEWSLSVAARAPAAVTTTQGDIDLHHRCMVPKGQGDCSARMVMWYYHPKIRDCRRFVYTGCNGNGNKFETREECRQTCYSYTEDRYRNTRPVRPQATTTTQPPQPIRTQVTTTIRPPRPFTDVTIRGVAACDLQKEPGRCGDWEIKWFFDTEIQRCNRFWFGGCGGNANQFPSKEECQALCERRGNPPTTTRRPDVNTCVRSRYGCCQDGYTEARNPTKDNCPENQNNTVVLAQPGEDAVLVCPSYGYRVDDNVAWYREGKLVETDNKHRVFSNGTLVVYSVTIEDNGKYACRYGSNSLSRFMLLIQIPIGIMPGPTNIVSKPNHMAFLHCQAFGNPKPSITWMKGNVPMVSDNSHEMFDNGTLLIHRAQEEDIDEYKCKADNGVSPPEYRTIQLSLREMLVARIENDNGRVVEGNRISLRCEGTGYPHPTITWEKAGRTLTTGGTVYIQQDGHLFIREAVLSDTGSYTCVVSNSVEKIETSTTVQVIPRDVQPDICSDIVGMTKCRLIQKAKLCSYTMYSKLCCNSCRNPEL